MGNYEEITTADRTYNWTYTPSSYTKPEWLIRGFTGHEHLPEFGLINMNGRMYDPVLGRMLSPDNYVQSATFTQTFNRYSYAGNNPLKYTDPTGYTFLHWTFGKNSEFQKIFLRPVVFVVYAVAIAGSFFIMNAILPGYGILGIVIVAVPLTYAVGKVYEWMDTW